MNEEQNDIDREANAESVRIFYDGFSDRRMAQYEEQPNLRIERALARILPLVGSETRVLEIGCGIGLITERIAAKAAAGFVWGCDISGRSIARAEERVTAPNVAFRVCDVVREFDELRSWIDGRLTLVVMADVLEHLPQSSHATLFRNLREMLDDEASIALTFPSPNYQQFLREKNPEELQIIDEVIELKHVLDVASATGFGVKHYSEEDVWLTNQYVHCVLQTSLPLRAVASGTELDEIAQDLTTLSRPGDTIILVDSGQWVTEPVPGRRTLPFLEREGEFWGLPSDDAEAIREVERMRIGGARLIAFTSNSFWWFEHYAKFRNHLESGSRRVLSNERLVVLDLSA
ncbi:MAG: class I SAM-dependent methyltransferase [Gemmatimonadaceae bacterium]